MSEIAVTSTCIKGEPKPKKPNWQVVLSVICPIKKRPRRMSLHTLANIIGLNTTEEVLNLAKELEESKLVVGYKCPDVQCLIFYLIENCKLPDMIDTRNKDVWSMVPKFLEENPPESIKGFRRFSGDSWSGGSIGSGICTRNPSGMPVAFEAEDYEYYKEIKKALEEAEYVPGKVEFTVPNIRNFTSTGNQTKAVNEFFEEIVTDPNFSYGDIIPGENAIFSITTKAGKLVLKVTETITGKSIEV